MRRLVTIAVLALALAGPVLLVAGDDGGGSTRPQAVSATVCRDRPQGAEASRVADVLGVGTHTMWAAERDPLAELTGAAGCGIRAIREDLLWEVVQPGPGRWDWTRTDRLFEAAAVAGVDVLGILGYSAPWASSAEDGNRNHPPDDVDAFAAYAAAVVGRYGSTGDFWATRSDLEPQPLRAVEIWNEPWGWWSWGPEPDVGAYIELALAAARAVAAADPDVTILVSGDLLQVRQDGEARPWLEELLEEGDDLLELVDAYSVHPYPHPRDLGPYVRRVDSRWDYSRVADIRALTLDHGFGRPIWITEIGWSTAAVDDGVTEEEQAEHLRLALARAVVDWPYVERVYVYTWTADRDDGRDREARYGLRHPDGTPKPALRMLVDVLRRGDQTLEEALSS